MKEFIGNLVADAQVAEAIHGEFQRRVRQIRAESALKEAVSAAGGRNLKAIRALVDESTIAEAQDHEAAARAAVAAVRQESPYLFGQGAVFAQNTGAQSVAMPTQEALGAMSYAEYRRFRKGM